MWEMEKAGDLMKVNGLERALAVDGDDAAIVRRPNRRVAVVVEMDPALGDAAPANQQLLKVASPQARRLLAGVPCRVRIERRFRALIYCLLFQLRLQ